jgi:hypothetical protein
MHDRLLIPLLPLALIAAGLLASIGLFLSLKWELQKGRRRLKQELLRAQAENRQLKQQMEEIALRLEDAEDRAGVLVPPAPPKSGLNLGRRTQVIRMWRRGDRAEAIATTLNLPKNEVELLLKVHQLSVNAGRLAAAHSQPVA